MNEIKDAFEALFEEMEDLLPTMWIIFSAMMIAGCVWFELAMRAI